MASLFIKGDTQLSRGFVVKDYNFTPIVMSKDFEDMEQSLMVEVIRRRQQLAPKQPQHDTDEDIQAPFDSSVEPRSASNSFGDETPCKTTIYNWFAELKRGSVNLNDQLRDCHPSTAVNNKNIVSVCCMIETDRPTMRFGHP
ncbi:hypothetical protein EVAR_76856_1 [Eumeta japonica]|uniref:Uncharacterized protein n=1 Tax=Eumeta variegata TaxID=151549 RepID=A0A4C1SEE2_EUMVA|nr:hypothetical protein EVAR_76856_1 [Eumeta japonica]